MTAMLREWFDWFLFDTLLWTGALIGFVLLLRRPVARHLGAGTAYALWALPAVRLVLPPVTLPAWMAPAQPAAEAVVAAPVDPMVHQASFSYGDAATAVVHSAPALAEPTDFVTPLIVMWLVGAAVFLARRFWLYGELRRELLDDAVSVGDAGRIRLVETPAISGPIAFGVLDKVVALPVGFMTMRDRTARDLAIAHELEHHRGRDLLANVLVQPLFAVHWFNPLGYIGWTALRRDQEAWCDARVVASRPREQRAAYAGVIADFARRPQVAPRPALAAPMACPVLGDKSIIQRLRNLSMNDVSPRRRLAARTGLVAALFALPMTASIAYASAIEPPTPPEAPAAPEAPQPPVPPTTPQDIDPMDVDATNFTRDVEETRTDDGHIERRVTIRHSDAGGDTDGRRVVRRVVIRNGKEVGWSAEDRAEFEKDMAELRKELGPDGEMHRELRMAFAEARAGAEEARQGRAEAEAGMAEAYAGAAEARAASAQARAYAPKVVVSCRDKENVVSTTTDSKGRMTMFVCEANADRMAAKALSTARAAIASDRNLSDSERAEALRAIDKEIADHAR